MNHAAIRYAVGSLVALLALFMLIPLLFAVAAGEKTVAAFAVPAGVALALGLLLRRGRSTGELGVHEAMVIVSVGWTCAAVAGAFPFMLSGTLPDPVDALFEAVSGITTTGATTFPDVERLPRSILLWRALLNWLGGLGIVVLFVSLLPRPGIGGVQLMKAEMPGMTAEKLRPRIRETGRLLWGLYLALTLLLFTLLWAVGIPLFDAVVHALATVSTGGVSTRNASIAAFGNPWAEVLITFFMLLGATHFGLLYRFVRRGEAGPLLKNREFQTMLGVIGVAAALIAWDLWRTGGAPFCCRVAAGAVSSGRGRLDHGLCRRGLHDLDAGRGRRFNSADVYQRHGGFYIGRPQDDPDRHRGQTRGLCGPQAPASPGDLSDALGGAHRHRPTGGGCRRVSFPVPFGVCGEPGDPFLCRAGPGDDGFHGHRESGQHRAGVGRGGPQRKLRLPSRLGQTLFELFDAGGPS